MESHLRLHGADEAADLAYVTLSTGPLPIASPHWQNVLDHLASLGLKGPALSRLTTRLGIHNILKLTESSYNVTQILCVELDLSPSMLRTILTTRPHLLHSEQQIRSSLPALRATGMKVRDIQRIVLRWPGLLTADASRLRRSVAFLCRQVGFSAGNLRSFLRRAPWILVYDVDTDMAPATSWLLDIMGDSSSVEHCIRACPLLLGTTRHAMQVVVRYLTKELFVREGNIRPLLRSFPPILTCSVEKLLRPAADYLRLELLIEPSALARVIRAFPAILTLDVDMDMRPVVEFFENKAVVNVGRLVTRLPPVLGYDMETNIIPKMSYLENVLGLSSYDIARFPGYFSYSLETRIEPRTRFLQALGKSVTESGLNVTLALTDADFCERVADVPLLQYNHFRKAIVKVRKVEDRDAGVDRDVSNSDGGYLDSLQRREGVDKDEKGEQLNDKKARNGRRRRKRFRATVSKMPWDQL